MLILTRRKGEQIRIEFPSGSETLEVLTSFTLRIGKRLYDMRPGKRIEHNGMTVFCKSWRGGQVKLGFEADKSIKIMRTELLV